MFILDDEIQLLMSTWKKISLVPNEKFINVNFKKFLKNNSDDDSEYALSKIELDDNGYCKSKDFHMKKFKAYNKNDLNSIGDFIKKRTLSTEETRNLYEMKFREVDEMIRTNKYDYVVDGLNVLFFNTELMHRNYAKINNLLEMLQEKPSKVLVILKEYLFAEYEKRFSRYYDKYPDVDFLVIDDKLDDDCFITYSALKSSPKTKFISNDVFKNQIGHLKKIEDIVLFKNWLKSNRIKYQIDCNIHDYPIKLIYPPLFNIEIHKVDKDKYVLPLKNSINKQFFIEKIK